MRDSYVGCFSFRVDKLFGEFGKACSFLLTDILFCQTISEAAIKLGFNPGYSLRYRSIKKFLFFCSFHKVFSSEFQKTVAEFFYYSVTSVNAKCRLKLNSSNVFIHKNVVKFPELQISGVIIYGSLRIIFQQEINISITTV